jgi:uncharacterized protein
MPSPTKRILTKLAGALLRYRTQAPLRSALTTVLLIGALPGVVIGAILRVFLIPGPEVFRLLVAGFLLPIGIWLCVQRNRRATAYNSTPMSPNFTTAIAFSVGIVCGIYGIGGGSLPTPILVGRGMPVATVAPATLVSTFITSAVGAITYVLLPVATAGHHIAPNWTVGLVAGVVGLVGGYLRAAPTTPTRTQTPNRAGRTGHRCRLLLCRVSPAMITWVSSRRTAQGKSSQTVDGPDSTPAHFVNNAVPVGA